VASCAATTEAPHGRESRRGRIPEEPLVLYEAGPVTLCSQQKSSPFWITLWLFGRRFFERMPGDALHPARESAESLANTRRAISEFIFASQYQQNPISLERVNAINAERERRFSDAYRSNDQLTLGRLWHNRITGTPEDEISDDLAMTSDQKWAAIVEKLEREI
jgi:hypothetical protein